MLFKVTARCFRKAISLRAIVVYLFVMILCCSFLNTSPMQVGRAEGSSLKTVRDRVLETGLLTIDIHTVDGGNPTYTAVDPPEGLLGASIADNSYVEGYCVIDNLDTGSNFASRMKLKVRGNTSARNAGFSGKLPYKLVLKQAVDLFGNGHWDKRFILLANAGESLKAYLGFRIGEYLGMEWNPECRYVNLMLNGNYRGIYLLVPALDGMSLTEHVGPEGFMIESDAYWWNEDVYFHTDAIDSSMAYTIKYPDSNHLTPVRLKEIHEFMNALEREIFSDRAIDCIDAKTFVAWIMARDLLGETDAAGGNMYYYMAQFDAQETVNNKLCMGPLWDFDGAFVLDNEWSGYRYCSTTYFIYLFNDRSFYEQYCDCWNRVSPPLRVALQAELQGLIATEGKEINASRKLDAIRWHRTYIPIEDEAVKKLEFIKNRITWINAALSTENEGGHIINHIYATVSLSSKTITVLLPDDGYARVLFPTWSKADGQDDIIWWEAHLNECGEWECQVDLEKHHSDGIYTIHAYANQREEDLVFISSAAVYVPHTVESGE